MIKIFVSLKRYIRNSRIKKRLKSCGIDFIIGDSPSIIGMQYITIGDSFHSGHSLSLQAWSEYRGEKTDIIPKLIIGNNVSVMSNCQISCANSIAIGDGCLFGDNVFITDNYHGKLVREVLDTPPIERKLYVGKEVVIGKNVWVGRNVCIMPGVVIGDGAVIGANAVVTHDLPEYCVAAGVPAKVIRTL